MSMLESTSCCTNTGDVANEAYSIFDNEVVDLFVESIGVHKCAVAELYGDERHAVNLSPVHELVRRIRSCLRIVYRCPFPIVLNPGESPSAKASV